jgi:hypothetical protein
MRFSYALVVALACVACNPKSLKPNRCHTDGDCAMGQRCDNSYTCVSKDASAPVDAMDASDATDATDASDASDVGPWKCMSNQGCIDRAADGGVDGGAGVKNVCNMDNGMCEECLSNDDCTNAPKPICNLTTLACERCTTDSQCVAKVPSPGICMFHQDGRCATDAETIYVRNSTPCSMSAGAGGTKEMPYCSSQDGVNAAVIQGRSIVVMRGPDPLTEWSVTTVPIEPITVVGQSLANVNPGARIGVRLSAGNVFIRGLAVKGGTNVGVVAENGAELHMDGCTVANNSKGGILVDGAAFDIKNTTITGNGPSADLTWGGIRVQNLLGTGAAQLQLLTIQTNNPSGVSCSGPISGTGIFAMGNVSGEISMTCGFSSCGPPPGLTCGAQ